MGCAASTEPGASAQACPAAATVDVASSNTAQTLFEKLGGAEAVDMAVDIFYKKIEADDELAPFFEGIDMNHQRRKQAAFMMFAFGGSKEYSGATLHAAHKKLIVQKGLQERHFDLVAGHLVATLQELNVSQALIDEVVSVVAPTKAMIFGDGP